MRFIERQRRLKEVRMSRLGLNRDQKSDNSGGRGIGSRASAPHDELLFTIGTMARDFSISLRALRFYEDRGLLHPIRRGSTRLYTEADRQHLELILRGKRLGFTLAEIHEIIDARRDKMGDLESTLQPEQIIAQIHHLERQREEIDEAISALRNAQQRLTEGWALPPLENGSSSGASVFEA
jgi:DNA-binding transcriptional MerR regulator